MLDIGRGQGVVDRGGVRLLYGNYWSSCELVIGDIQH